MRSVSLQQNSVLLVGAGKMGGALLTGWLNDGNNAEAFTVLDPAPSSDIISVIDAHAIRHMVAPQDHSLAPCPSFIILAVKPQLMPDILPDLSCIAGIGGAVIISIAAGVSIATLKTYFGDEAALIRAMPNTPAQIGRGVTVGYATPQVTMNKRDDSASLLAATGHFDWVDDEALIDAVTAVSGSGPAYVFYLVEALAEAAEKVGLSPDLARHLARSTVEGAGELLYRSELDVATLREHVTSPGGTTAAALEVLMGDQGLGDVMVRAVHAARERAYALGRSI